MFEYQAEIASKLGGHLKLQYQFKSFGTGRMIPWAWLERVVYHGTWERREGGPNDATFVNLLRLSVLGPLFLWIAVVVVGGFNLFT